MVLPVAMEMINQWCITMTPHKRQYALIHRPFGSLFKSIFRVTKTTPMFHITGPLWWDLLVTVDFPNHRPSWWRHETFSALLAICAGNSPVPGEFPTQRSVTRSFDVFFDLRLNKRLNKRSWGWWFETPSRPLWRHRNVHLPREWSTCKMMFYQLPYSMIYCIYHTIWELAKHRP